MIRSLLHEFECAQRRTGLSARQLSCGLPRSTIQRWQHRARKAQPLVQSPGPKKLLQTDWPALLCRIHSLHHGRRRSQGTTALYQEHQWHISRRQFNQLVQEERRQRLLAMQRIHWLLPGTAWSIDATAFHGLVLIPLHDLASRYRFDPLLSSVEDGSQIAAYLHAAFSQHGPPLFLKRDNGSPFNCAEVNQVLADHRVLPLNSPPHYPPYNGGMEKSIGDLKRALLDRLLASCVSPDLLALVHSTNHQLNHQPRRCLKGRNPCQVHHDPALRAPFDRRARLYVFNLLLGQFYSTLSNVSAWNQHTVSSFWRRTVFSWLRCQGLISCSPNSNQNQIVSTTSQKKWSHN
jgi:transposase InsO family protein